ncbi:heterokaryon incompatibility, partial [Paraphoma chrysanthemicola]
ITTNVDDLLRHLRKPHHPRALWIDALCIDQTNDLEKAEQVAKMGIIYKWADKTHVWLGTATNHDLIPEVFALLKKWAISVPYSSNPYVHATTEAIVPSLSAFLMRPWFTRRWILQEVLLPRAVTIHCGHHSIPW